MATNAAALNTTGLSAREAAMLEDTDVLGHIRSINERINRDAIAEGWQFWTTVSEDIASEYANVYEYEHSGAVDSAPDVTIRNDAVRLAHLSRLHPSRPRIRHTPITASSTK